LASSFAGRIDVIYQPDLFSGSGVDHIAGQYHLHCLALADQVCQTLGSAAAAHYPKIYLGLRKAGILAAQPQVARHRELVAAAEAKSVDHCDHRLWKIVDRVEQRPLVKSVTLR
jgi:hypothetical protein